MEFRLSGLLPTRSKAYQREALRVVDFPGVQRWNSLLLEAAKACQSYFCLRFGSPLRRAPERSGDQVEILRTPVAAAVPAA
jgi:hypothetical protein